MATVFFFKENDTNDRDCVKYLDINMGTPKNVCGACFSGMWREFPAYENVTTILTEDEYNALCNIKFGDSDVDMSPILTKLTNIENQELFKKVQQEEVEYLVNEYNMDEDDVQYIFDYYTEPYRDRGVIGYVYEDYEDLGYETAWSCGYIGRDLESVMERYFDFEKFGEDLAEEEDYFELSDGRIVSLNY